MEEKELNTLLEKVDIKAKEAAETAVKSALQGVITPEALKDELTKMEVEGLTIKQLFDAVTKQGDEIKKLIESGSRPEKVKTIGEQIKDQHAEIKKLEKSGDRFSLKLNIRQMLNKATIIDTNWASNNVAMNIPEINNDPFRLPVFRNEIPKIPVQPDSRGMIFYTEQDTVTRGAAARTTGNQAGASTLTYISRSASLTNITDSIKIAKETLMDWSMLSRDVQKFIELNLGLIEDEYLWDGTGVAPILKGLYTYATAYAASGVKYGAVTSMYDLIADMKLQVETGYNGKYTATHVVLNNQDAQAMWSLKDSTGRYEVPWFVNAAAKTVWGLKVIESSIVDQGTCLVGDFRQASLFVDEEMTLEFGLDGEDFSKRLVTLLGNIREYLLVKNIDTLAFIACADTDAAIEDLKTVG